MLSLTLSNQAIPMSAAETNLQTALYDQHVQAGAKMVPFAGYDMPVNYPLGIMKEHLHTREKAGLFDVSHMGQIRVAGPNAATHLESLIPVDIVSLAIGRQKYGLFTNDQGGLLDDLMVIHKAEDEFILVVNAACKTLDYQHVKSHLGKELDIEMLEDRSLLALQGPESEAVLTHLNASVSDMLFMDARESEIASIPSFVTRSGYTGEDGFEISVATDSVEELATSISDDESVEWIGLGARDSLRLEAGLSLYGHELSTETTPVEAGLIWALSKPRRLGGEREGGFPGADVILPQVPKNVDRIMVGLLPLGRAPVREGASIEDHSGNEIGVVTSGGFAPSLGKPICMGYVKTDLSAPDTELNAVVRDKRLPVVVTKLPFVPHGYRR